jgi:hypothetical protein
MLDRPKRGAKKATTIAATFGLWLVTAVLGLWLIQFVRNLMARLIFYFTPIGVDEYAAFKRIQLVGGLSTFLYLILGLAWIAAIIGGAEYHRRRLGQPESWRLFGWIVATEMAILLLGLFV